MSKRITKGDLIELYNQMQLQMQEDRETIVKLYNDLKSQVIHADDYAMHGLTLAKYGELMTKSTAQLLELIKLGYANSDKENVDLTDDEKDIVYSRLVKKDVQ